jgi:flagellar biosynthesis/type III secretory pathway protein FliH
MDTFIQDFGYPLSGLAMPTVWQELAQDSSEAAGAQPYRLIQVPDLSGKEQAHCNAGADSLNDDNSSKFEEGHTQGYREGRCAERAELAARIQSIEMERIEQAARLNEQFERERERYVQSVECEIAKLALSIASRILRREMQIDPLLLTGAVRVALGQIKDKVSVRMRVPAGYADMWSETMEHLPNLRVKPRIVADKQLQPGECFLETEMGSADVGVRTQFCEIARNLFEDAGRVTEQVPAAGKGELAVRG